MATYDFRVLRRDQPINASLWITSSQFYQNRDRVHHVPQRRGLDQENPRKFGGSQGQPIGIVWEFSPAVQLPKGKSNQSQRASWPVLVLRGARCVEGALSVGRALRRLVFRLIARRGVFSSTQKNDVGFV